MWAQLITIRAKPGKAEELIALYTQIMELEPPDSGRQHSFAMRDQHDPSVFRTFVVFDSEEAARARENDPRRRAGLAPIQERMAECCEAPPEFVDLTVVRQYPA